jgi:hypothetical protein
MKAIRSYFFLREQISIDGDGGVQFVTEKDDKGVDLKPDEDENERSD